MIDSRMRRDDRKKREKVDHAEQDSILWLNDSSVSCRDDEIYDPIFCLSIALPLEH